MSNLKFVLMLTLLSAALCTVVPHVGKIKSHYPRTYNVSLDDALEDRWRPILNDYKHAFKLFIAYFDLLPIPETFFKAVDWYAHNIFTHKDFVAEVDALSKVSGH